MLDLHDLLEQQQTQYVTHFLSSFFLFSFFSFFLFFVVFFFFFVFFFFASFLLWQQLHHARQKKRGDLFFCNHIYVRDMT